MQDDEINSLIVKYIDGKTSENESKLIDDWYASFDASQGLIAQLTKEEIQEAAEKGFETFKATVLIDF